MPLKAIRTILRWLQFSRHLHALKFFSSISWDSLTQHGFWKSKNGIFLAKKDWISWNLRLKENICSPWTKSCPLCTNIVCAWSIWSAFIILKEMAVKVLGQGIARNGKLLSERNVYKIGGRKESDIGVNFVRIFGLANYYQRFVDPFLEWTKPL